MPGYCLSHMLKALVRKAWFLHGLEFSGPREHCWSGQAGPNKQEGQGLADRTCPGSWGKARKGTGPCRAPHDWEVTGGKSSTSEWVTVQGRFLVGGFWYPSPTALHPFLPLRDALRHRTVSTLVTVGVWPDGSK